MRQIKVNSLLGNEIITTADVKSYVRIDTNEDDALIANMITEARIWCENYISRDIVAKTELTTYPILLVYLICLLRLLLRLQV